MYDVSQKTLQWCINDIQLKLDSITKNHLLTSTEEDCLLQWIILMNKCDMSPRITTVHKMMCVLVTQQQQLTVQLTVGKNWVQQFINCYDILKLKYNCKYNYQQAKCEDSELI